jgi:diadenosine tetraphosphate (Ap4A) HIT family hydrolase|tara:strand:+ start:1533 stop:1922 length:390 start_codon:yes stop_codon:yes gene_type:complete
MDQCIFCREQTLIYETDLTYVTYDTYPASPGHALIITKRHVANYFDCTQQEVIELWQSVEKAKQLVDKDHSPDSYNIGINVGSVAGQSVPHIHIHLIPRYKGDVEDPRGGVRGVIPNKRKYIRRQDSDQ